MSELRVSRALRDNGATLPADGTHIYLTDTLESPAHFSRRGCGTFRDGSWPINTAKGT